MSDDLLSRHDVLLADLDGTLYRGPSVVPGAVEAVRGAAERGVRTVYVTNNASRSPSSVAEHLAELGFAASSEDVVASSQAAATMLAEQLPAGARVLVVGAEALAAEVTARGLRVVTTAGEADAVVQGHSPHTGWAQLAEATVAVRAGALWVACNLDATLPTERGPLPGNGAMVGVVRLSTGREPQVAGKPGPALLLEAARRTGAQRPLMIGDRLDTDIEGGRAADMATLLVLTGISDAAELLAAPPQLRPDYVAADLDGLTARPEDLAFGPRPGWDVRVPEPGTVVLSGSGADPVDALRALCAAHWAAGGGPVHVTADGDDAAAALGGLGLDVVDSATVAGVGKHDQTGGADR
ncbi:HAD-IIA family hydrolase [Pseudonocardia cypriaca]|uniref:HAD superfamily hydrolase (TIGR01450 family) n=1 Tax=Pseudonocardia cypriaca TaxID=882449 RepID=A0A543FTK6_9PSEU|nr:HAD-IIA family hydrolase [Pseudonocardia cypriaca]TQM37152.1 HAD superfamily hydrolase (TIGR01450 family) [Pseudonocardia cypriaca]